MALKNRKIEKKDKEIKNKTGRFNLSFGAKRAVLGIIFLSAAALVILTFFNLSGRGGEIFYNILNFIFGWGYYALPVLFLAISGKLLFGRFEPDEDIKQKQKIFFRTFFGASLFLLTLLGLFQLFGKNFQGGWIGFLFSYPFIYFFGFWASLVLLSAGLIISILIVVNFSPRRFEQEEGEINEESETQSVSFLRGNQKNDIAESDTRNILDRSRKISNEKNLEFDEVGVLDKTSFGSEDKGMFKKFMTNFFATPPVFEMKKFGENQEENVPDQETILTEESDENIVENLNGDMAKGAEIDEEYSLPPLDLLEEDRGTPSSGDIRANANIIKRTLENFGVDVEMGEVNVGPTVTQYTLKPAQGVKLSRITGLQNDLSLALAAHPLRLEAPIPGKSLVGLEIPNKTASLVRLKNLLEQEAFDEAPSYLTFVLGRDVAGLPIYADLARMPHLLIAGSTGSGKSVCVHDVILSFLYRNYPKNLKFIFIDPKRVELTIYNGIPHLLTPVITDGRKAVNALRWAVGEMERRYQKLEQAGARDIGSYNSKIGKGKRSGSDEEISPLPFIVIVIDELADLMAAFSRDVESSIVRLAQMARAVGIHLIVSTQRPSVEVITGLIKANITSRIAFQVASQIDSRTILDMSGAEKLLGSGDMLFLSGDALKPKRIQGSFVTEKEIRKVSDYLKDKVEILKENTKMESEDSLMNILDKPVSSDAGLENALESKMDDELYSDAKQLVIEAGKASASLLQRRLRVGYARAARLLDMLEDDGIIGPGEGAKPREILIAKDDNE